MKSWFQSLLTNLRFYILVFSVALSGVIYGYVVSAHAGGATQLVYLEQFYALTAVSFLYLALLAGPFCFTFRTTLPPKFRAKYLFARRAIGVSAFYFAFLHANLAFFGQLGGFNGLAFLSPTYLIAIACSGTALTILFLLAITSFDKVITKMTFPKWKALHRFIYLAGVLAIVHALLLGTHFSNLSGTIPLIGFIAVSFLLLLEAPRFDKLLAKRFPVPQFGLSFVIVLVILAIIFFTIINPVFSTTNGTISFDIHAAHKQLAQQAQQGQSSLTTGNLNTSAIPGLDGDRTKRYTVSMRTDPPNPLPNQDVTIYFKTYDASTGYPVTLYKTLYSKPMHFIIVNSGLTYFHHIHPTQTGQEFSITTQFPTDDLYHLYIEFWPYGGIEQQVGFSLPVGTVPDKPVLSHAKPDDTKTKSFGEYMVSVDTHGGLSASAMTLGSQTITFTIKDAKTGKPVTNLKPYLASFGHLTMINERTFDFIHVHPYNLTPPPPNAHGGPTVDFLPIGIYGPFKPGVYRAFAEFSPDSNLFTADFTIQVN
jgi:DMSO/TMAO reductase YedYZ heme-binding membrane subunit